MRAHLIMKDGTVFRGRAPLGFGGCGEVVFATSMAGCQEILTTPSYYGQMVAMTFPEQGICGIHRDLHESGRPWANGFLCRRLASMPDHVFAETDVGSWLKKHRLPLMTDIDTRALTLYVRDRGSQPAVIWTETDGSLEAGIQNASAIPDMAGQVLCATVSCKKRWEMPNKASEYRIAVLDFGVRASVLNHLHSSGFNIEVFPWDTEVDELLSTRFCGIVLSDGPGDPAALVSVHHVISKIFGKKTLLGIGLGHQLLIHAHGGSTYKMPYGHHGANHPVCDSETKRIEITLQNHGFAVDKNSLPNELEVTHSHFADDTVEGVRHRTLPVLGMQYNPMPDSSPNGVKNAMKQFVELMVR